MMASPSLCSQAGGWRLAAGEGDAGVVDVMTAPPVCDLIFAHNFFQT
jgi:hypothetical protein